MSGFEYPAMTVGDFGPTRDALHAYSKIPGDYLKALRPKRKHWWHISLRPSLRGLATGVVRGDGLDFELELDLHASRLRARTATGADWQVELHGQPAAEPAARLRAFLLDAGLGESGLPSADYPLDTFTDYAPVQAAKIGQVLAAGTAVLENLRAGIREETSPIGLWAHHFDLAMLFLPGGLIEGQDPADEEHADRQMNFGFAFGDGLVPEPYFYATAYPTPKDFPQSPLAEGVEWHDNGFRGMVWRYGRLRRDPDPGRALQAQWQALLDEGRRRLAE